MQTIIRTAIAAVLISFLPLGLQAHVAGLEATNATVYVNRGDVNGDGMISVADVMLLVKVVMATQTTYDAYQADVNADSAVTVTDVMILVRWILNGYVFSNEEIQIPVVPGDDDTPGGGWGPAQAPQGQVWEDGDH